MLTRWTAIIAIFTLVLAPAAMAQDHELRGTVTARDATTLTVETGKGQVVTFEITEQSLLPEGLSVGDFVAVHHLASTGEDRLQPITEVLIADELEAAEVEADAAFADDFDTLPQTATPLAGLALFGLAAMGAAAGLRRRRR